MNHTQPTFVGIPDSTGILHFVTKDGRHGKFVGVSPFGFLPALEVPEKGIIVPIKGTEPDPWEEMERKAIGREIDIITQLRGQVIYNQNRLNEHLDKSKKKRDRL